MSMEPSIYSEKDWKKVVGKVMAAEQALSEADNARRLAQHEWARITRALKGVRDRRDTLIIESRDDNQLVSAKAGVTRERCAQIRAARPDHPRARSRVVDDSEWGGIVDSVNLGNSQLRDARNVRDQRNLAYSLAIAKVQQAKNERDEMIIADTGGDTVVAGLAGISRSWCATIRSAHRREADQLVA